MRLRRIILIVATLVAVMSSMAAVSAFEAHAINVTAHVENALTVDTAAINFGTTFPQEWRPAKRSIALSSSFLEQPITVDTDGEGGLDSPRVIAASYQIWAECKWNTSTESYFLWLGDALWIDQDDTDYKIVGPHPNVTGTTGDCSSGSGSIAFDTGFSGTLGNWTLTAGVGEWTDVEDFLSISLDTPVFEGFYNEWTDVCNKPRPDFGGLLGLIGTFDLHSSQADPRHDTRDDGAGFQCQIPTWVIPTADARHDIAGSDMGADIKVQVTGFTLAVPFSG